MRREPGRPALGYQVSEKPAGAVTLLLFTAGAPSEALAVATLLETRLARDGLAPRLVVRADSVEATLLVVGPEETARALAALRLAMTRSVAADDEAALRRLTERAKPSAHEVLLPVPARCVAESTAADPGPTTLTDLERARRAAATQQRASLGVAGTERAVEAARSALREGNAWPSDATPPFTLGPESPPGSDAGPRPHTLRLHVSLETRSGASAGRAAGVLGRAEGPLARLVAREGGKVVRVAGVPHLGGGCLDLELALPLELPRARAGRLVARAEALARGAEATPPTRGAAPEVPSEAAQRAAVLAATSVPRTAPLRAYLSTFPALELPPAAPPARSATARVESGPGAETWVLLAAPCGARDESEDDAGFAAVAMSAAASTAPSGDGAVVEPWITPTAIGLLAHGPPRAGEPARATRQRLASLAAAALAAPAPRGALAAARARAVAHVASSRVRALSAAGEALLPGRVPLVLPGGTATSLARASDEALRERAVALAEGPLQAIVLAPTPDGAAPRDVGEVLAAFALGSDPGASAGGCRELPKLSLPTTARALTEIPHGGDASEVLLLFPDASEAPEEALAGLAELVTEGGLASELGARAAELRVDVIPVAASRALSVRFVASGGARGAREAILAARTFLARPPSEQALARLSQLAEARRRHADQDPRALLGRLLVGAPARPLSSAALRASATHLFASGGLAAVVGRAR